MAKCCESCGSTNFLIKQEGSLLCHSCFEKKSPFIDEVLRIIDFAINNNLIWIDFDAIEKRRRTKRDRDSL